MKNKKAFTLIELLIVIAIIGLLAAAVLVSINVARERAKETDYVAYVTQVWGMVEKAIAAGAFETYTSTAYVCPADYSADSWQCWGTSNRRNTSFLSALSQVGEVPEGKFSPYDDRGLLAYKTVVSGANVIRVYAWISDDAEYSAKVVDICKELNAYRSSTGYCYKNLSLN